MDNSKPRVSDLSEYVVHERYKMSFILMIMITMLLSLLDNVYGEMITNISISLIVKLQKIDLSFFFLAFSYLAYFFMYLYILCVLMLRRNQESNISLIFGACCMIYVSTIFKLIMLGHRPMFTSNDLNSEYCICDYGKPASHMVIGLGTLMLIYTDIKHNHKISAFGTFVLKFSIIAIQLGAGLGRLYTGANSINQIVIGWSIGITMFLGLQRIDDYMQKYIIWPIFYKDRFRDKRAIFHLLFHMMWGNYLLFWFWAYRYTTFDIVENKYFSFENCKTCLAELAHNFSVKVIKDAVWFNLYFGMMLGIYVSKTTRFMHTGFYTDGDSKKCAMRMLIFLLCISPLILAFVPTIDNVVITFVRILVLCIVVGILSTSSFYWILDYTNLSSGIVAKSSVSGLSSTAQSIIFKS